VEKLGVDKPAASAALGDIPPKEGVKVIDFILRKYWIWARRTKEFLL